MSYFHQKRLYSPNFAINSHFSQYTSHNKKKKIVFWFLVFFLFFVIVGGFWFTRNVLIGLPDVSKIKDIVFNEATLIEDRNGEVLYRLFEENREYVGYTGISQHMIDAIVALEDQRYRQHNGLDAMGMLRAALKAIIRPGSRVQGASTIPQQLIRNLLLTKDRKITRKLKEILLTSKLSGVLEKMIRQEMGNLSPSELHKEMKKRTLELYLNYISFGNNAYGVEAASKTYFGKSAKDLTILEASILASIPKGPSLYNPYKNKDLVVGSFDIKDTFGNPVLFSGDVKKLVVEKFTQVLNAADFSNKKNNNAVIKFIDGIGSFQITISGVYLNVKYQNGRKDLALNRMFEDGYISDLEFKEAIIQGITYEFRKNTFPIKAPHFVQWIIEELEKKYGSGTIMKGGFVVKTTLDSTIQKVVEEALLANNSVLQDNGANNTAMIYLDSKNGDVLAYVGSIDYFNQTIKGQNDMIRRPRQTGSAIKPLIYALALEKLPLTLDSPIFDIPFKIGADQPNNADDKFEGLLPLKFALGHSRNIPAAKTFITLGGEVVVKPFLKSLGLNSLSDNIEYGYPLALGAGEVTMLEFANAYMHLSTSTPAQINPILEIRARDGSLLYQKTGEKLQQEIIKPGIVSLLWKILADPANRIPGWENKFTVPGLKYALKTGTSNAKTDRGNRARDGWLAAYTPSKVMIFRAGNADGTPMNRNAFGGTIHANPVKKIFSWLLKNNYIINQDIPEIDLTSVQISKISGKAVGPNTPASFIVNTLKYKNSPGLPIDEGASLIKYDSMCNGKISPYTPDTDIKDGYLIVPSTFMVNNMDLPEISQRRKEASAFFVSESITGSRTVSGRVIYNYTNIFVQAPIQMCPSRDAKLDTNIKITLDSPSSTTTIGSQFDVAYTINSPKNIRKVMVMLNTTQVATFMYPQGDTKNISDTKQVSLVGTGFTNGSYTLDLVAFDFAGFSNKVSIPITLTLGSSISPVVDTTIPKLLTNNIVVKKNEDGMFTVKLPFDEVVSGKITRNGVQLFEFKNTSIATFTIDVIGPIVINVQDAAKNIYNQIIDLSIYNHN